MMLAFSATSRVLNERSQRKRKSSAPVSAMLLQAFASISGSCAACDWLRLRPAWTWLQTPAAGNS